MQFLELDKKESYTFLSRNYRRLDTHTGNPPIGRVGVGKGLFVGRRWHGKQVTLRLDYDPIKGPHINVTDYRFPKNISIAIPFEGNLDTVKSLLKHLNC